MNNSPVAKESEKRSFISIRFYNFFALVAFPINCTKQFTKHITLYIHLKPTKAFKSKTLNTILLQKKQITNE